MSENICTGAVISNTNLCPGGASNPNITCCIQPNVNPTQTPTPTTAGNGGGNTSQPTATPTTPQLPTSSLCGGEYTCDACDCPAGQICEQKCYTLVNPTLCLTQSCSNDQGSPIHSQTCSPTATDGKSCTDPYPGGHGLTLVSCTGTSECEGVNEFGCKYCQTRVATPTATPATFSNAFINEQSCQANYVITESSNKTDVSIAINASTANDTCPVLLKNGVYDPSVKCSRQNGRLVCSVSNVGMGKHVFELRFGQSSLYGKNCGQAISCNNIEFALTSSGNANLFADVDQSGSVNVADFITFGDCYRNAACVNRQALELNGDGVVDILDYNLILSRVTQ